MSKSLQNPTLLPVLNNFHFAYFGRWCCFTWCCKERQFDKGRFWIVLHSFSKSVHSPIVVISKMLKETLTYFLQVMKLSTPENINCRDTQGRNSTPLHLAGEWKYHNCDVRCSQRATYSVQTVSFIPLHALRAYIFRYSFIPWIHTQMILAFRLFELFFCKKNAS